MPAPSKKRVNELESYLDAAAAAAHQAIERAKPEFIALLTPLRNYDAAVKSSAIVLESSATDSIRAAIDGYQQRYDELRSLLDDMVLGASKTLQEALADLERDADFVTPATKETTR